VHFTQLLTKRCKNVCGLELAAEDFKSYKTLKQENTPQERTKGILNKAWRRLVDKISVSYASKMV
jgi:hypothetical protein